MGADEEAMMCFLLKALECPEENRAPAPAFIRVKGYSWAAGDAVQRKNAEKVVKKNPQQLINLIRSVANSKKNLDHILHS